MELPISPSLSLPLLPRYYNNNTLPALWLLGQGPRQLSTFASVDTRVPRGHHNGRARRRVDSLEVATCATSCAKLADPKTIIVFSIPSRSNDMNGWLFLLVNYFRESHRRRRVRHHRHRRRRRRPAEPPGSFELVAPPKEVAVARLGKGKVLET